MDLWGKYILKTRYGTGDIGLNIQAPRTGILKTYKRGRLKGKYYVTWARTDIHSSCQPSPELTKWQHINCCQAIQRTSWDQRCEVWTQLYMYRVGNGIPIVQMYLIKHIRSQLTNGGYRTLISYSGKPATSYWCGDTEQISQDCPRRTGQEAKMRLTERPT